MMWRLREFLALGCLSQIVFSIPLEVLIPQGQSECLYDALREGEAVTMSVFILAGDSLKADTSFEGPFAPMDVDSGADLMEAIDKFETSRSKLPLSFRKLVDFEHLNDAETFTTSNSMDDDEPIDPDDPDAADKRKERRQKRREKQLDMKRRKEQKRIERQRDMRDDGDPFERTTKAPESGWYRVCVHATFNLVTVEFEMRKESELGGVNEDTGHVNTYEDQEMYEELEALMADTAVNEGIQDEDFENTRQKLKELRRLLNEIQSMQQKERRRLVLHATTNEHSHSRMVLSSLLETLLFMAVTGYQVFTIRRWFSGAPALGR